MTTSRKYFAPREIIRDIPDIHEWASSRETHLAVACAVHAIATVGRPPSVIWEDPTPTEWNQVHWALAEYLEHGDFERTPDDWYSWGLGGGTGRKTRTPYFLKPWHEEYTTMNPEEWVDSLGFYVEDVDGNQYTHPVIAANELDNPKAVASARATFDGSDWAFDALLEYAQEALDVALEIERLHDDAVVAHKKNRFADAWALLDDASWLECRYGDDPDTRTLRQQMFPGGEPKEGGCNNV